MRYIARLCNICKVYALYQRNSATAPQRNGATAPRRHGATAPQRELPVIPLVEGREVDYKARSPVPSGVMV